MHPFSSWSQRGGAAHFIVFIKLKFFTLWASDGGKGGSVGFRMPEIKSIDEPQHLFNGIKCTVVYNIYSIIRRHVACVHPVQGEKAIF